jgi:uncharacterized SAM-binding protein YcdF (DUF218 family)
MAVPGSMVFVLSKVFWAVVAPGNFLVLLLVAGILRAAASRRRRRLGLIAWATAGLLAIAVLPLGDWAVRPLEARFPAPELPAHVDGIIVLGGAVEPATESAPGQIALTAAAERVVEALALARRYPEARLLLTGGDSEIRPSGDSEAEATRTLMVQQGIDGARILVEQRSRNTYENATLSQILARPQPGEIWMLVTSAAHMPRAVGCFRRIGWSVLPYPVDYRGFSHPRPGFALLERLAPLDLAEKEWIGLVVYRLLGRTDAWFPAP